MTYFRRVARSRVSPTPSRARSSRSGAVSGLRRSTDAAAASEPAGRKGARRRAEVLAEARRVLVDDGYDRFVMREIAAGLGITLGNLQYYFASRDDLLEAVIRAEFDRNQGDVQALASGPGPAGKRLEAIVRRLVEVWAHEGGRVYVVMSLLAIHQARFAVLHREIYRAFYDGLLPLLQEIHPRARRTALQRRVRLITTLIDGALVQAPDRAFLSEVVAAVRAIAEE